MGTLSIHLSTPWSLQRILLPAPLQRWPQYLSRMCLSRRCYTIITIHLVPLLPLLLSRRNLLRSECSSGARILLISHWRSTLENLAKGIINTSKNKDKFTIMLVGK